MTSAHHSCLGTAHHTSESTQPGLTRAYLGSCTHHFLGDELDVALVRIRNDIPKQFLVNILEVPYLGQMRKYMPDIWTGSLRSLATRGTRALKHGPRGLVPGRLVAVRGKTWDDKIIEYVAFIADQLEPAAYQAGDSGSLVTSIPGQDLYVDVYGLVSGLRVINGTQYCTISPVWPALQQVEQTEGVTLRVVGPVTQATT